jgi:uncharacterized membrane protein
MILVLVVTMLVLDAAWLALRSSASSAMIAALQGSALRLRWIPTVLVYAVMAAGVYWFAVRSSDTWKDAAVSGAALGFVVYGVYDLTNYATLARYPLDYALADWLWGTFLFATTAAVAVAAK